MFRNILISAKKTTSAAYNLIFDHQVSTKPLNIVSVVKPEKIIKTSLESVQLTTFNNTIPVKLIIPQTLTTEDAFLPSLAGIGVGIGYVAGILCDKFM